MPDVTDGRSESYLTEAALENIEAIADSLVESDLLKGIPVVSTFVKVLKAGRDIRDRIFVAKIARFLGSIESVSHEAKEKIREKVASGRIEATKVGETVLLVLDRASDLDKADVIAMLFLAYVYGHLRSDEFRRICQSVDGAFMDDLQALLQPRRLPERSQEPFMRYLAKTGLTQVVGGKTFGDIGEVYYGVSSLGNKFINAYRHGKSV